MRTAVCDVGTRLRLARARSASSGCEKSVSNPRSASYAGRATSSPVREKKLVRKASAAAIASGLVPEEVAGTEAVALPDVVDAAEEPDSAEPPAVPSVPVAVPDPVLAEAVGVATDHGRAFPGEV